MGHADAPKGLQLRSLIKSSNELELSLVEIPTPEPGADEVIVRIEATPVNPSDIGLLVGAADLSTATQSQNSAGPVIVAKVPDGGMKSMAVRLDQSMPVGNEGAGVVVRAGSSEAAQALLGKTVAAIGGAMYSQYRCLRAKDCLVLPEGATPVDGASCFVNPLTSLGMVETMRRESHTALVHTAAASNLGQMLNRICIKDGIGLVNIVRSQQQENLLRSIGATYVCNSTSPSFLDDLTRDIAATGATLAFDATGGGRLASQILSCMETAINANAKTYNRYGSSVHKQVYIYGSLNTGPTELVRSYGMAWGIGGWLLFQFLQKIGSEASRAMRQRILAELKTTFASRYTRTVSLQEALQIEHFSAYTKRATGEKYLINPNK